MISRINFNSKDLNCSSGVIPLLLLATDDTCGRQLLMLAVGY